MYLEKINGPADVNRLREKIEADPSHPNYLLTVRGLGYRLSREGTK